MTQDPLARPIWSALTGRQAPLARGDGRVLRFPPDQAYFIAARDPSPESLAQIAPLIPAGEVVWLLEREAVPPPRGTRLVRTAVCLQMVAATVTAGAEIASEPLGEADAAEMLALATLTEPGPFLPATHRFGEFVGLRDGGRLVAMAGTRLRPGNYTEVSGVCTHPDARGRGLASGLTRAVMRGILARGETPFLQAYADHAATIRLYESLGFAGHAEIVLTVLARA